MARRLDPIFRRGALQPRPRDLIIEISFGIIDDATTTLPDTCAAKFPARLPRPRATSGARLIEPPAESVGELLADNRRIIASADYDMQGLRLADLAAAPAAVDRRRAAIHAFVSRRARSARRAESDAFWPGISRRCFIRAFG